jgi:hypothetical protein
MNNRRADLSLLATRTSFCLELDISPENPEFERRG